MPTRSTIWDVLWFAIAILISAFLVFQVQPVVSKTILPWFGGSPGVWTTCMLFFQVVLFAGYTYAHITTKMLLPKHQGLLHFALILVALFFLPISLGTDWKPSGAENPTVWILLILAANVGLPYFLLCSTGPLLQAWFAAAIPDRSPYRLYALSNVGSLVALLSYPFIVEPSLTTRSQGTAWSLVFCGFAAVGAYLSVRHAKSERVPNPISFDACPSPTKGCHRIAWLLLPAFASVMLLTTTNHVCQDLAVIPLLWVAPLSLYLLTFIICFDRESWYVRGLWSLGSAVLLVAISYARFSDVEWAMPIELTVFFAMMFFVCMVCHGELVRLKPAARELTAFYLMSSAGGALGGITVALLCPWVFNSHIELHIVLVTATAISSAVFLLDAKDKWLGDTPPRRCIGAMGYLSIFLFVGASQFGKATPQVIASVRNFYGVLKIEETDEGKKLVHGQIIHGFQFSGEDRKRRPTMYYNWHSGVGLTLKHFRNGEPKRVGLVGLGCGTLAAYGRPGDYYRFYEINPDVAIIAEEHFSFLADCEARHNVILGDARVSMEREPDQDFDVLVLDAFSGDAIPTHLLTKEAFAIYQRHVMSDGVIAVHVSNRHLDLKPVVERLAREFGLSSVRIVTDRHTLHIAPSHWILVSANRQFLESAEIREHAKPAAHDIEFPLWTDQYNNVVQLLDFN